MFALLSLAQTAHAQPEIYGNPSSSAFIRIPKNADDWTRHFRIGAMVGLNISASFNVSSGLISGGGLSSGNFADGYVRTDNTGNAGGYTSYWGYDKASQYNSAAQTLTLQSSSSFTVNSGSGGSNGDRPLPGFDMAYGDNLWYWKHARVGWELGFDLLPISIKDAHTMSASVNQTFYEFSTANPGNAPIPTAPYQGGYNRQLGDWTIPDTPYNSYTLPGQKATITGSRTLDVTLYTIRLGPNFYWDLTQKVGMSLGAGPVIGIADGNCSYNENITINNAITHNTGGFGSTDVVFGGYVNGTIMYHVQDNGQTADLYLSAQYMPMQDASFSGSGRSSRLNLGGQVYISAGINWPF